jgi:hypothetical protein
VNYHYALVAQNSSGTVSYGGADGFTLDVSHAPTRAAPALPVSDLSAPTFNGPTSVTLQGTINPEGSLTTYYFTEGVADSSGSCTPTDLNYGTDFFPDPLPGSSGSETTPFPVSQTITDLTPGTTYCFGLAAFNAGGSATGAGTTQPSPVAPTVAITSVPPPSSADTSTAIAFIITGDSNGTTCTLDGATAACASGSAHLTSLSVGSHTFVVTVSGPGGSNFAAVTWEVTPPAPTVTITSAPPANSANTAGSVAFTVSGDSTGTACTLDGVGTPCDSESASFTGLNVGSHTFVVVVSGPGGTASAATTWEVTASPPGPIPSPIPAPTPSPTPAPTPAPEPFAWSALHLSSRAISNCPARARSCASANATFSFTLTQRAQLTIILSRKAHGKTRVVARVTVWEAAGVDSYVLRAHFGGRVLAPGAYQLNAQAVVGAQHSSAFRATLRVL